MTTTTSTYRYGRLRIAFFHKEIPTVAAGRAIYFPVRAMCTQLGIRAQMQVEKLRADSRIAPYLRDDIPIPTVKGLREATCIRKQDVGKWLATLDPARCALGERTRADLERFQAELFAAADRFSWGDTGDLAPDPATGCVAPAVAAVLEDTQRAVTHCPDCGSQLLAEVREGKVYLWHAGAVAGMD